jgi:hypothetical protein
MYYPKYIVYLVRLYKNSEICLVCTSKRTLKQYFYHLLSDIGFDFSVLCQYSLGTLQRQSVTHDIHKLGYSEVHAEFIIGISPGTFPDSGSSDCVNK